MAGVKRRTRATSGGRGSKNKNKMAKVVPVKEESEITEIQSDPISLVITEFSTEPEVIKGQDEPKEISEDLGNTVENLDAIGPPTPPPILERMDFESEDKEDGKVMPVILRELDLNEKRDLPTKTGGKGQGQIGKSEIDPENKENVNSTLHLSPVEEQKQVLKAFEISGVDAIDLVRSLPPSGSGSGPVTQEDQKPKKKKTKGRNGNIYIGVNNRIEWLRLQNMYGFENINHFGNFVMNYMNKVYEDFDILHQVAVDVKLFEEQGLRGFRWINGLPHPINGSGEFITLPEIPITDEYAAKAYEVAYDLAIKRSVFLIELAKSCTKEHEPIPEYIMGDEGDDDGSVATPTESLDMENQETTPNDAESSGSSGPIGAKELEPETLPNDNEIESAAIIEEIIKLIEPEQMRSTTIESDLVSVSPPRRGITEDMSLESICSPEDFSSYSLHTSATSEDGQLPPSPKQGQ